MVESPRTVVVHVVVVHVGRSHVRAAIVRAAAGLVQGGQNGPIAIDVLKENKIITIDSCA